MTTTADRIQTAIAGVIEAHRSDLDAEGANVYRVVVEVRMKPDGSVRMVTYTPTSEYHTADDKHQRTSRVLAAAPDSG